MEFVFHPSGYDGSLEEETAELLRQRLESRSRQAVPGMWSVTDKLNAHAAKGAGREARQRRYRVYGVVLMVLGVAALVPGLMKPRTPSLIAAGLLAIAAGILNRYLVRERKSPPAPPASCQKEAAALLAGRRAIDWENAQAEVRFGEAGAVCSAADSRETVPYREMRDVFETARLWLVVYGEERALLLQKKDLAAGEAEAFLPDLRKKIAEVHSG